MLKMTEREEELKKKIRELFGDSQVELAEDLTKELYELDQKQRELEAKYGSVQKNREALMLEYRVRQLFIGKQFLRVEVHPTSEHWPIQIYYPTDSMRMVACFWSAWEFVYHWCNKDFRRVKDHIYLPFDEPRQFRPIALEDFSLAFIDGVHIPDDVEIYSENDAAASERENLEALRLTDVWDIGDPELAKDKEKMNEALDCFEDDMEELFGEGCLTGEAGEIKRPIAIFPNWQDFLQHYIIWYDDRVFEPITGEFIAVEKEPRNPKWMIPHARCWWKYYDDKTMRLKDTPFESFEALRVKYRKVTKEELQPFIKEIIEVEARNRLTDAEMQKKFGNDWKKWRAPSQEEVEKMFKELEEEDRREGLEEAKRKE